MKFLLSLKHYKAFHSLPNDSFGLVGPNSKNHCRQQNIGDPKTEICFGKGRKHWWKKKRNAVYHLFLLFLQC